MDIEIEELHPSARRFAEEYVRDFKIAPSAERAGVSEAHARDLLRDPRVQALIKESKRRASENVAVSVDMVLDELRKIATASALDAFDVIDMPGYDGKLRGYPSLNLAKLTDDQRAAIKSIKFTKEGPSIEFHDKIAALHRLGLFFSMFTEKHELTGPGGAPLQMITETMTAKEAAELYKASLEGGS